MTSQFAAVKTRIQGASVGLTLDGERVNREACDIAGRTLAQHP
jgi:hypothetical protein